MDKNIEKYAKRQISKDIQYRKEFKTINDGIDEKLESKVKKPKKFPNYPIIPLKKIHYVIGPNLYYHYKFLGKNIYLFGEYHTFNPICNSKKGSYNFEEYLSSLFLTNKDILYDVFIEERYKKNDIKDIEWETISKIIIQIQEKLTGCFTYSKNCIFPNVRGHYIDYRIKKYDESLSYSKYTLSHIMEIFDNFIKSVNKEYKINKQYQNIPDKYLRDKILLFFDNLFLKYKNLIVEFYENHYEMENIKLYMYAILMDKYLIGRMFRTFKDGPTPMNIIVYTGSAHTEMYVKLFNFLNVKPVYSFENINIKEDIPYNCVKLNF